MRLTSILILMTIAPACSTNNGEGTYAGEYGLWC